MTQNAAIVSCWSIKKPFVSVRKLEKSRQFFPIFLLFYVSERKKMLLKLKTIHHSKSIIVNLQLFPRSSCFKQQKRIEKSFVVRKKIVSTQWFSSSNSTWQKNHLLQTTEQKKFTLDKKRAPLCFGECNNFFYGRKHFKNGSVIKRNNF